MRASLRTTLLAFTAAGLACGCWAWSRDRQAAAVRGILALGGAVYYDDDPWVSAAVDPFFEQLVGKDGLYRVATACPSEQRLGDTLPHLRRLRGLRRVHFFAINDPATVRLVEDTLPGVTVSVKFMR